MYKIYLEKEDVNNSDATSYYVSILEDAIKKRGNNVEYIYTLKQICRDDIIVVIQAKAFFKVWLQNHSQKIYIWFQGVVPEEAQLKFPFYRNFYRVWMWRMFERIALKNAQLSIFVSHSMLHHYQKQYNYNSDKHFVMPCFNLQINKTSFFINKYDIPTFVYAGSVAKWQCLDKVLEIFGEIEKVVKNAHLTILTKELYLAEQMVKKYRVCKYTVKYVDKGSIVSELSKYKYGFLLRTNIIVNNVATPVKMNSYLAAGVIPIYTDVIDDFKKIFCNNQFVIKLKNLNNIEESIKQIKLFERQTINSEDVFNSYLSIFDNYYNRDMYITQLEKIL